MKKTLLNFSISTILVISAFSVKAISKNEFGVYRTKEDYMDQRLELIEKMQESDNFNVGILLFKGTDNKEHKINCNKEKYWGFRYVDGNDYVNVDGFYAKIVVTGRINLLISPKATFTKDENDKFTFSRTDKGKINFYFIKDLNSKKTVTFEKLIADEKALLKEYRSDRDNYGDFINKQLKYLKKYNEIVPKPKKVNKKLSK